MPDQNPKTVVFGLDGACFELIEPWLAAGALPTLQKLIDSGGRAPLRSCVPATTPPAWTSLTTGVNPGKHGIFGFYRRHSDSYGVTPVTDQSVSARRLWDYTSEAGLTSLVVNVPVTHPARELTGALVPGYLAPDRPDTFPPDILEEVGMSDYRMYAESEAEDVPEEHLLSEWLDLTDSRAELTLSLMDHFEWDLLFVEFQKTDGAVHKFSENSNIRELFERVDDCMATILDAVDATTNVFVVSDHGIGQSKEWSVALNTWLVEEGYAKTTIGSDSPGGWRDQATGDSRGSEDAPTDSGWVPRLLTGLSRIGITKQQLERALSRLGLYELVVRLAPEGAGDNLSVEVIDRAASKAFYEGMGFSGVDVGVVVNDERFYADGVVAAAEYDELREELMAAFRTLEGPDGQLAFQTVRPREEVYDGNRTVEAPDIVLEQSKDYVIGSKHPRGATFIPADEGRIDHTREGIFVATGPDISSGWEVDEAPSILDVTPSLLHLLDIPLNDRIDGTVLTSILDTDREPTFRSYEPVEWEAGGQVSAEEEEALEDRLRSMGYLE